MRKKGKITLIILVLLVIGIGGVSYGFVKKGKKSAFDFVVAEKMDLVQEVSVTGKVKPKQNVDLSFEKSGWVAGVYIEVGHEVKAGQLLITLDQTELTSQLKQAEASLEQQQAKLDELVSGPREEEIKVAETKLLNAKEALNDAKTGLQNVRNKAEVDLSNLYDGIKDILNDAYVKSDNAVNEQTDEFFSNDLSENPKITFSVLRTQLKIDAESQRRTIGDILTAFKTELNNLPTEQAKLDDTLLLVGNRLATIRDFLTLLNDVLNSATNLSQTTITTYKGYLSTARTNINTALTNISTQIQSIASQKATNQKNIATEESTVNTKEQSVKLTEDELALKKAGATEEQIKAQEAQVKVAEASVENIKAQLGKMALYSPITGIVTKQKAKKGEIASAGETMVSVISEADFEVECFVPEVDIAKVKTGDPAKITLDAYSNDVVFAANVATIDPAETIVEGVATYKVGLQFAEKDERVKPGMTANIDILTAERKNVIAIPSRAVISKNGAKIVRILKESNGKFLLEEQTVETGLVGSDGKVEIREGITEGDKVITSLRNNKR